MSKELTEYLFAFLDKWFFWAGIVFLIPELLKKIPKWKESVEKLPHKFFWVLSALCFLIASFQLWHEEHVKALNEKVYLVSEMKEFYPSFATDLFFKDQPLKIDVHWRNVGRSVAENPFPYAKVYLVPDASNANQLKLIDQFDGEYLGVIKNNPKWETTPVLPYNPAIPETVYTAQGQNVSDEDLKKIHSAQAAVFVIGAVRYKDNLGTHDAHACAYLTGIQRLGTRVDLRWQDCLSYVTPVEVR